MRKGDANAPRLSLKDRIFFVVAAIAVVSALAETFFVQRFFEKHIVDAAKTKTMSVARRTALDPDIIAAFDTDDPSAIIQPIAENIRILSETSYVVVMNMDAVRYSHVYTDRLGKHFVGGDEQRAIRGKSYISQAEGTLGLSIRAFVPIYARASQIGVVSVGLLLQNLEQETRKVGAVLYTVAAIGLAFGLIGAAILARDIKKTILGLEPHEIAAILEERNVVIASIKEGIIAIDGEGKIILTNESAKRILDIPGNPEGRLVTDIIPNSRLISVARSGQAEANEEQVLNGKVVIVNRIPLVAKNKTIGAVATFRDLSEVRAMAEELTEVKRYIDALRAQHHEHLNQLHVVSGLLQLGKHEEAIRYIAKTVSLRQKIFDTLRTRIRAPGIAAIVIAKMNEAQEANIEIHIDEESALPPLRESAEASLVTIVGNLLQNAIEALRTSTRRARDKRIELWFRIEDNVLTIRVHDNGDGFGEFARQKLFERGNTTKSTAGNMGIGLSLVKMHAEMLGGSVELIEEDGVTMVVRVDAGLIRARDSVPADLFVSK